MVLFYRNLLHFFWTGDFLFEKKNSAWNRNQIKFPNLKQHLEGNTCWSDLTILSQLNTATCDLSWYHQILCINFSQQIGYTQQEEDIIPRSENSLASSCAANFGGIIKNVEALITKKWVCFITGAVKT